VGLTLASGGPVLAVRAQRGLARDRNRSAGLNSGTGSGLRPGRVRPLSAATALRASVTQPCIPRTSPVHGDGTGRNDRERLPTRGVNTGSLLMPELNLYCDSPILISRRRTWSWWPYQGSDRCEGRVRHQRSPEFPPRTARRPPFPMAGAGAPQRSVSPDTALRQGLQLVWTPCARRRHRSSRGCRPHP
jgi:hypothetical protein